MKGLFHVFHLQAQKMLYNNKYYNTPVLNVSLTAHWFIQSSPCPCSRAQNGPRLDWVRSGKCMTTSLKEARKEFTSAARCCSPWCWKVQPVMCVRDSIISHKVQIYLSATDSRKRRALFLVTNVSRALCEHMLDLLHHLRSWDVEHLIWWEFKTEDTIWQDLFYRCWKHMIYIFSDILTQTLFTELSCAANKGVELEREVQTDSCPLSETVMTASGWECLTATLIRRGKMREGAF